MLQRMIDFDETDCLRDSEIALMDAFKVVFEILLVARITPAQLDKLLASVSQPYSREMSRATFVNEQLRLFVQDIARAVHRQQVRRVQEEPPAGSA
jgi:hypothetical protein